MEEEILSFGTVSSAVKIGDAVHRQTGPWTPTIHALLNFLNEKGFSYAPHVLGMDEQGREILTFLPGIAASRPWPTNLFETSSLVQAAKMLRQYHDIVEDFQLPDGTEWRGGKIQRLPGQTIRHGDIGPWNTLWQGNSLTGLIDWDFAEPGERVTDLAQMAYYFIPLRGEDGWRQAGFKERPNFNLRLKTLLEAYGMFSTDEVVDALLGWLAEELRRVNEWGGEGREPWSSFLLRGDDREMLDDIDWIKQNRRSIT